MRRLVKHGIAGVGFAAFTVTTALAALGSPATQDVAIAVPAASVSVEPSAASVVPTPASTASAVETALAAERADRESRDAQRAKIEAAVSTQAGHRAATLSTQSKSIAAQQKKLLTAKAMAKAKAVAKAKAMAKAKAAAKADAEAKAEAAATAKAAAAAAAAARKRAVKARGYESGTTDPREIARQILENKYNYGSDQYECFNFIIMRESMWKVNATNRSSGAYGIPQALPGTKMASAGSDWRSNPATQIIWGIDYMKDRYGSPCQARTFKAANGWY